MVMEDGAVEGDYGHRLSSIRLVHLSAESVDLRFRAFARRSRLCLSTTMMP